MQKGRQTSTKVDKRDAPVAAAQQVESLPEVVQTHKHAHTQIGVIQLHIARN